MARHALIAAAGVLVLAVPGALAITQPWNPTLGRPAVDGDVPTSSAAVIASARSELSVLRREQTVEDRRVAEPLLRTVNAQTDGVQIEGIRALSDGWALVPVKTVGAGTPGAFSDGLCATDGQAIACAPASLLGQDGVRVSIASSTETQLVGLVPDRVASVRFIPAGGNSIQVPTPANFYSITVPVTRPPSTIQAPDGYEGSATVPAPPLPAGGTLHWLDRTGAVIGPERQ